MNDNQVLIRFAVAMAQNFRSKLDYHKVLGIEHEPATAYLVSAADALSLLYTTVTGMVMDVHTTIEDFGLNKTMTYEERENLIMNLFKEYL